MASTSEVVQSWLNSGSSKASEPGSAVGASTSDESISSASPDSEESVRAENSSIDDLLPGSEDTPPDSTETKSVSPTQKGKAPQKTSADKEIITVTDENGRKRQVEIDLSNREEVKKAYSMMHGARKWQAERDRALTSAKEVQTQLETRNKDWQVLEQAFQKGADQLFDLLAGRRGAFDEMVQGRIQRAEYLKSASPQEVQALEAREQAEKHQKDLEQLKRENADFKKQVTEERETAELRSVESRVNPVFDKYRFADKLGNPDDEHMFDEMLWTSALNRLMPYEEKGVEITPELVEREFRTVASALRRRINVQAEQKASRAVQQKKQEATENVQAKLKSGYDRGGNTAQEARSMIDSGNLTGLLKGWGKYGSLFQKK